MGQLRLMQKTLQDRAPSTGRVTLLINAQHRLNDIVRVMFAAAPTAIAPR